MKFVLAPGLALLISLSVAGCGQVSMSDENAMNHGMMQGDIKFSSTDIMFLQMMIPHHQQAVEMVALAETRTESSAIRKLARQIKDEQLPEISKMQAWLESSGAGMNMGHDMGMNGMLSAHEMAGLKSTTGALFDRLFLQGMIGHHKGAIDMAQIVRNSNNSEVRALAESIVRGQTNQIAELNNLLNNLT